MYSTSGAASRQLTETITALALATPNSSSKMSLLLSRWAMRACGLMPSAIRPLATRLAAVELGVGRLVAGMDQGRGVWAVLLPLLMSASP